MCLICKDTFSDGASLANHKNEEHNVVHFCPHCYSNFPDQTDLSHHLKTMHKPTVAYMSGPGEVIRTNAKGALDAATRTSTDTELTPSSTGKDGAHEKCTMKCMKSGHVSDSCPRPRITGVEAEFWKAFPKSKAAYEAAIASGYFDTALVDHWDHCLMAYITTERKLESATPTSVIPPPDPSTDEPKVVWRPNKPIKKPGPVGLTKPRVVKLIPEPKVVVSPPPKGTCVTPSRSV
jgi:hypothetical protein